MKRLVDIFFVIILVLLLLPLIIFTCLLVKLNLGSPIFFKQPRSGLNQKIFNIYKFRTMTNARDKRGELLPDEKRLTKFGKFLRLTSIDELPGFLNVIKGEMSLVGPRPLLEEYLPLYSKRQSKRHKVRPGITGWAQVNGRNSINWQQKFELDIWYVENQSFWLDIKILWMTIKKVIMQANVNQKKNLTMEKFRGNSKRG